MSTLRTIGGYAKVLVVWFIRLQILVAGGWGVYGAVTAQWAMAAVGLVIPVAYFGRFVYRRYQETPAQREKKIAD